MSNEIWITGIGFISPLGDHPEKWWSSLQAGETTARRHPLCGYDHHPILDFDPSRHVQRRADVRQMGDLMLYCTVAASKALESAGLKPNTPEIESLQIIIAAGGGERDLSSDQAALAAGLSSADSPQAAHNAALMSARPSHFLTQLPNLIPSNICIVNGIAAPSRTLLGTEATSVEAMRDAVHRIASGQGELYLVGSGQNADDAWASTSFCADGVLRHDSPKSAWDESGRGFCIGSVGAFVVLESERHARARGANALARVRGIDTSFARRDASTESERRLLSRFNHAVPQPPHSLGVISGISGDGSLARRERNFLAGVEAAGARISARAPALIQGHAVEGAFFSNLILGLLCLQRGELFSPLDPTEPLEQIELTEPLKNVLVTSWGTRHAEGFVHLETVP